MTFVYIENEYRQNYIFLSFNFTTVYYIKGHKSNKYNLTQINNPISKTRNGQRERTNDII